MGKKVFSLCMALALCLALLPATALAAEGAPNNLYVGNQNVKSGEATTFWTTDSSTGKLTQYTENEDAWNVKYDPNSATLTLRNATIKTTHSDSQGAVIYAHSVVGSAVSLTINLEGTNKIECDTASYGIYVNAEMASNSYGTDASLTITGQGSLDVSGSTHGIFVKSGKGNASLNIEKATVTSSTDGEYAAGVCVQSSTKASVSPKLSLAVNGGSLTASGSASGEGIKFYVGAYEATSATTSLTVTDNAIVDARTGGISASGVSVNPNVNIGSTGGIVFDGTQGTVYGNVELQDDLTINEGETLTVGKDASLTVPDGKTLTNNGTINVESGGKLEGTTTGNGTLKIAPTITTQPQDVEVKENETATFTVKVTGTEPLSYQWQQSTDKGSSWTNINSATSDTYTTGKTTMDMSGTQYRCVVKNSIAEVTSDAATLTVTALPEPEPEPEPTPPPYIPPTYAVTTPETPGGTVTVSPSRASSGRTVTITAAPDTGFALESLTVLDSRDNEITLTDKGDGKYTFTMPASRVTVEASFTPAPLPFEDVTPGAWYENAVRYAYLHDIMEGMSATTFQPNGTLSRAMAVQIFYNLEGQPDVSDENLGYPYEDVNAEEWYGNAVYWARLTGVATGYGDGTFQPTDSITRQEFAQMLYNYAKYKGYDLTAEGDLSQFPDSGSVADWAEIAMSWANGNELINGHDDGTIDAGGIGTRAQAASILMRFDQNLVKNRIFMQRPGVIPAFCLPEKRGLPPTQKVEPLKQRKGLRGHNFKNGWRGD